MPPSPVLDISGFCAALVVALGGSLHCAGMCGGFAVASGWSVDGAGPRRELRVLPSAAPLARQLLYHCGKTTTYLFLGAIAGLFGTVITTAGSAVSRSLSVLAAVLLVIVGAGALGLLPLPEPRRARGAGRSGGGWLGWARIGATLLSMRSPLRPLYLGVFSGFLPCPLVYAFLAHAAACGSVLQSMATLGALGAGTVPVLLSIGLTGGVISPTIRRRAQSTSGVLMILLAAWTLYRGWAAPPCCPP